MSPLTVVETDNIGIVRLLDLRIFVEMEVIELHLPTRPARK